MADTYTDFGVYPITYGVVMRPRDQPIPVLLLHCWGREKEVPEDFVGTAAYKVEQVEPKRYDGDYERVQTFWWYDLPPQTQVVVLGGPNCDYSSYYVRGQSRPTPRLRLGNLDNFTIEPCTKYFRPQFRKSKLWQARWRSDLTKTEFSYVGRAKKGCTACKRAKRSAWWGYRKWTHARDRRIGCRNHIHTVTTEVPHPDAGKVAARFSTEKLIGLPPGTGIIFQVDKDRWLRGEVGKYTYWEQKAQAAKDRAEREKEAAAKLKLQKEQTNAAARARFKHRRHMAQPTWLDRILADD